MDSQNECGNLSSTLLSLRQLSYWLIEIYILILIVDIMPHRWQILSVTFTTGSTKHLDLSVVDQLSSTVVSQGWCVIQWYILNFISGTVGLINGTISLCEHLNVVSDLNSSYGIGVEELEPGIHFFIHDLNVFHYYFAM